METNLPSKNEILDALEALKLSRHPKIGKNDRERELFITPYPGERGAAGVALTLNGTPPQAHCILSRGPSFTRGSGDSIIIHDIDSYRARRIKPSDTPAYAVLRRLFNAVRDGSPLQL